MVTRRHLTVEAHQPGHMVPPLKPPTQITSYVCSNREMDRRIRALVEREREKGQR